MVVDITFAKTAPKMYSAVQTGTSSAVTAVPTSPAVIANGAFCSNSITNPSKNFCLPENANTNGLMGAC